MSSRLPQEISDAARAILRLYNECEFNEGYEPSFQGPHYVTWECGEFYMRPFGGCPWHRCSFHCIPQIVAWQVEPLWTFEVMC